MTRPTARPALLSRPALLGLCAGLLLFLLPFVLPAPAGLTAVAMAASCAFMLAVATTPNALVFATGHVTVGAMVRSGIVMNLLSILLVSGAARLLAPLLPVIERSG